MPTRVLREGILDSLLVNSLSEAAEILYRRLMSVVDDYGRCDADAELIRARCFPRQLERWPVERVAAHLRELQFPTISHGGSPLVTVYSVAHKKYLQINNFGQRVQSRPKFPGPEDGEVLADSTVDHRDSPPRAWRARTKSETKSESETNAKSGETDSGTTTAPVEKPVRSFPPQNEKATTVEIPDKRMDRPMPSPPNRVVKERLTRMRGLIWDYMRMAGTDHEREYRMPDDGIVTKVLIAVGAANLDDVATVLGRLSRGVDDSGRQTLEPQSPLHPNGPKSYAWFATVLAIKFSPQVPA